jgi:hypothetical protein
LKNGLKIGRPSVTRHVNDNKLILVLVEVDDEEIRPRTDPSSVSDFGTGLGSSQKN